MRETCLAHPSAAPLIQTADYLPSNVFRPMEMVVSALHNAGLSRIALRAYSRTHNLYAGSGQTPARASTGVDPNAALWEGHIDSAAFPSVTQAITSKKSRNSTSSSSSASR